MNTRCNPFALGLLLGAVPLLILPGLSAPENKKGNAVTGVPDTLKRLEAVEKTLGLDKYGSRYVGRSVIKRLDALEFSVRGHLPDGGDPITGQIQRTQREVATLKQSRTGLDRELTRLNAKLDALGQAARTRNAESPLRDVVRNIDRLERRVEELEREVRRLQARR